MVLLLARCWDYRLKTEDVLELCQGNRRIALCTVVGILEDGETYSTELKQRQRPGQGNDEISYYPVTYTVIILYCITHILLHFMLLSSHRLPMSYTSVNKTVNSRTHLPPPSSPSFFQNILVFLVISIPFFLPSMLSSIQAKWDNGNTNWSVSATKNP